MADTVDSDATQSQATGGQPESGAYTPPSDAGASRRSPSRSARTRDSALSTRRRSKLQQWREEFPYHWNADDFVTRRDTLRFLVAGSGALLVANAALAIAGSVRSPTNTRLVPVAQVGELAVNSWKVIDNYPDPYSQGILVNLPGKGLVAYSDVCTHLSCAVLYQTREKRFYCPCHEGMFDAYTGEPIAGPPTRPLPLIELAVRGGVVYFVREVER
jgi:nitrite reductase/ring-hydroxylating ferredoxin subunit